MSLIKVPDAAGATMTLLEVDGLRYPQYPVEAIQRFKDIKLRPDDVLFCAYPKCGSHWMFEIVSMLTYGEQPTVKDFVDDRFLEFNLQETFERFPSPRNLNTHMSFHRMPRDMLNKKCKVVLAYRNPKDVIVSYFHHHKNLPQFYGYYGEWENYFEMMLAEKYDFGGWWDYYLGWETGIKAHPELPVCIVSYENMLDHPLQELRKLASFLEKDYDDEFLQLVRDSCSFSNLKKMRFDEDFKTEDGKSVIYRKGIIGDWKNMFTVAQNERMDSLLREKMADSTLFPVRYTSEI